MCVASYMLTIIIQVCRLVDPLCDSIIRRTTDMGTGDVWDYVGYMLHYLGKKNPLRLFKSESHDAEHDVSLTRLFLAFLRY